MVAAISVGAGNVAEMAYVGETPWHGLGNRLRPGASLDEWTKAAGMGWTINRANVRYPVSKTDLHKPDAWVSVPHRVVLSRSDTNGFLSIVSDDYEVVHPKHVMDFFRDLTAGNGMEMETAGTLFGGTRFWALAKVTAGEAIRDGADKVGGYLLLVSSADGTLATEGRWTTVRVVCSNTLDMARYGKRAAVRISHREFFDPDAAKQSLGIKPGEVKAMFAATMADFRTLAGKRMTVADMEMATMETLGFDVFGMSSKERQEVMDNRKNTRLHDIMGLAQGNNLIGANLAGASGTAWGWLNAVTQYTDHHARTQDNGDGQERDRRLNTAWFGAGNSMKRDAFAIAAKHAGLSLEVA